MIHSWPVVLPLDARHSAEYVGCLVLDNWVKLMDVAVSADGVVQCKAKCARFGFTYFALECPMSSQVHCHCSAKKIGKEQTDEFCTGTGTPPVQAHDACVGPYVKDGYSFGDNTVGAVYRAVAERNGLVGARRPCTRFVILTTQRSGSTHLDFEIDSIPAIETGKEGYNMYYTHFGGQTRLKHGLSKEAVDRLGAVAFTDLLWEELEQNASRAGLGNDGQRCAIGFQMMGLIDRFSVDQALPILQDRTILKIMLKREDTRAQWISLQKALCFDDWDNHLENAGPSEEDTKIQQMVAVGKNCGGPTWAYEAYKKRKDALFKRWDEVLASSGQNVLRLHSKSEDANPEKVADFLLSDKVPLRTTVSTTPPPVASTTPPRTTTTTRARLTRTIPPRTTTTTRARLTTTIPPRTTTTARSRLTTTTTRARVAPRTTSAEPHKSCTRFLILTMQRSGSTHLFSVLQAIPTIVTGKEAFVLWETQFGGITRNNKGLSKDDVKRLGATKWANIVFADLQEQANREVPRGQPCAIGFQLMGLVDDFSVDQTVPLLQDPNIKKIVLRRQNSTAQWLSLQKGLCFDDWGSHHGTSKKTEEDKKLQQLLARGQHCGGQLWDFKTYVKRKEALYKRWDQILAKQSILRIRSQTEDADLGKVREFLVGGQSGAPTAIPRTTTPPPRRSCGRFLILTMQRSGSTHLYEVLRDIPAVVTGKEAFVLAEDQFGGSVRAKKGLSKEDVVHLGASKWASMVYADLQQQVRHEVPEGQPCAVGFQLMGLVDSFSVEQSASLIRDTKIKKIVLRRENTSAQWLSLQRGLCFDDWGSHYGTKAEQDQQVAQLQQKLARGQYCGGKEWAYDNYKRRKEDLYKRWGVLLAASGQKVLRITTETENEQLGKVKNFLIGTP